MSRNSELICALAEYYEYNPQQAKALSNSLSASGLNGKDIITYIEKKALTKVEPTERLISLESSLLFDTYSNPAANKEQAALFLGYAKSRLENNTVQQALDFAYAQVEQVKKKDYVVGVLRDMGIVSAISLCLGALPYGVKAFQENGQKEDPKIQKGCHEENNPQQGQVQTLLQLIPAQNVSRTVDYPARQPHNLASVIWQAHTNERG